MTFILGIHKTTFLSRPRFGYGIERKGHGNSGESWFFSFDWLGINIDGRWEVVRYEKK